MCENNFYGEFTPMRTVTAGQDIAARAGAFGIPGGVVDGNDVWAVREAALEAVRARPLGRRGRRCSSARPTATTATPRPTRRGTGRRRRSSGGSRATRSKIARDRLLELGVAEAEIAEVEEATRSADGPRGSSAALAAPYPDPADRARDGVRAMTARGLEFRVAIREAIIEEMERDEAVVFFGEDVAAEQGGVFAVTPGIQERFGSERVFDTPISELALSGAAFGAAVAGLRPIIEIMFGDFMGLAMDSLVNQSAKYWYLSGEQRSVPLVVRSAVGGGGRFGAIHSQTHATWFQGVPGLKIVVPVLAGGGQGPAEGRDPRRQPGDLPRAQAALLGQGARHPARPARCCRSAGRRIARAGERRDDRVRRQGRAPTRSRPPSSSPATAWRPRSSTCARYGRSISTPCSSSVARTNRVLAVEEGPATGGWGSGLLGQVAEHGLHDLDDAWLLATDELPIPYSPTLEDAFIPGAGAIAAAVARACRDRVGG